MLNLIPILALAVLAAFTTVSSRSSAQCNLSCSTLNVGRTPECSGRNLGSSCTRAGMSGTCQYQGCAAHCTAAQGCTCSTTLTCKTACGDGAITGAEQCDPGRSPSGCSAGSTCTSSCTCQPICGNGRLDSGEVCDGSVGCGGGYCNLSCSGCVGCSPGEGRCLGAGSQYGDYQICSPQGNWESYGPCCEAGYIDCMYTPYPGPYCGWVGNGPWSEWNYYNACF